ncbi:hypothetical protein [Ruania albidiflava]|uniref:hypothetical protein n=1 Tax=Ruania albidiflava TaxID=366586 RepID=UPI0012FAB507|nr:hypothetical protein [Ruania albidiflava]
MERAEGQHTFPHCDRGRTGTAGSRRGGGEDRESDRLVWNDHRMQQDHKGSGFLVRIGRRVRRAVQPSPAAEAESAQVETVGAERRSEGADESELSTASVPVRPGSIEELRALRAQIAQVQAELAAADQERESLKAERLHLQEILGAQHGKRVLPRLKVEKTNGVASLVAGARMMQRVHGKADDPVAGIDGAGALFADAERTTAFLRSHGVRSEVDPAAVPTVVVHAFKGRTPLLELWAEGQVRHLTPGGEDPGDIRPGVRYDPEIPAPARLRRLVRASRTLSTYVPRPYVQIRWCEKRDGTPVLVGIDVNPQRIPVLTPEWDERLGKAFDSGHARMLMQPYKVGALDNRVPGGTFSYEETV